VSGIHKGRAGPFHTRVQDLIVIIERTNSEIMLPDGFPLLVNVAIKDWGWDKLPRQDDDVWDALLCTIFLGPTARSVQAAYAKEILYPLLRGSAARAVMTDPNWSRKITDRIKIELGIIRGSSGEGFKRAILNTVAQEASRQLGKPVTPKQAQAAVWYLQSCRGLLPRNHRRSLSPRTLVDFLRDRNWDIGKLDSRLGNVEELEDLMKGLISS